MTVPTTPGCSSRPRVDGKFLAVGSDRLWVKGSTYGTFRPRPNGCEFPDGKTVQRDFALMRASGLNAVRTYGVPPTWLLDAAFRHGLHVLVGHPWEQHVAFLDGGADPRGIEERLRAGVRACKGHPAVLGHVIGNEIPAPLVRWHGGRRVERFLHRLYRAARDEDPEAVVTYVNYPSTEYLQLPFLDLVCFNVYLEARSALDPYLARLQNLAGDRPLLLTEIGLDSRRNGERLQAETLRWQVRAAFDAGCAGAFVFAWTDEWHRGGWDIEDWNFGLTDRERRPKPALQAVCAELAQVPVSNDRPCPRFSVVVCTYNGTRTIENCLCGLSRLEYPDLEVIVVDDGSSDATAEKVRPFGFRLIRVENGGLSKARNIGLEAATGELVAYLDDDAWPDPHWLSYLARTFQTSDHVGVGGPNLPPPGDGLIAECVARSPGRPTHVLLTDSVAEHIPGCNMAFRRDALRAVGGFDPRFLIAGDDADVCWTLQAAGGTLGFHPSAVVWHHCRNSVRAYLQQQINYGRAEAMLERKWPEKYNAAGHASWRGRLYGHGTGAPNAAARRRVYHGVWGSAPFQSIYEPAPSILAGILRMPDWYLLTLALGALALLGLSWGPLVWVAPVFLLAVAAPVVHAIWCGIAATARSDRARWRAVALTALLHVLQPIARLAGRLSSGLAPWRRPAVRVDAPLPRRARLWSESCRAVESRLEAIESALRYAGVVSRRGGAFDRWELHVRGGLLGGARMRMATEEHGEGKQLVRLYSWPVPCPAAFVAAAVGTALAVAAGLDGNAFAAALLGIGTALVLVRAAGDCGVAAAALRGAVERGLVEDGHVQL